jgi:hypothetical protein
MLRVGPRSSPQANKITNSLSRLRFPRFDSLTITNLRALKALMWQVPWHIFKLNPRPFYEIEILKIIVYYLTPHKRCTPYGVKKAESQLLSTSKLHIHTLPDPTPMATVFADTAEHDGRYSDGNHTTFLELYVIHAPLELNPPP